MEGFTIVLVIIFGILSLILFFKMWVMCNDVYKIRRKILGEDKFKSSSNTENHAYDSIIANIKELIFCDKNEEAKYELKKLLYQFVLLKKEWTDYPHRFGVVYSTEWIIESNKRAERVLELLESIGETIENKEEYIIPINKQ